MRDEDYASPLRDWLGEFSPQSLLILDEAHNAAPASGTRYAVDSQFTKSIRELAPRFEHRLFLSATPHNGHSNSFSSLLEILDPQRFCRGVPVEAAKQLEPVMVRRLKEDLRLIQGGFPKRLIVEVPISALKPEDAELKLPQLLDDYREARKERLHHASKSVQNAAQLVLCNLQKRLLSSIEAFASTLRVHRQAFEKAAMSVGTNLQVRPGSDPFAKERSILAEMTGLAEAARGQADSRVKHLIAWCMRFDAVIKYAVPTRPVALQILCRSGGLASPDLPIGTGRASDQGRKLFRKH